MAAVLHAAGPRLPLGLDRYRPVPESNPLTPEKVALGRQLFNDRKLSRDGSLACASCHDPRHAFADDRPVAVGIGGARGERNVPAIVNRAWGAAFFWDGRAPTLEQQALQPVLNPQELAMTPERVIALARSDAYRPRFRAVFNREPEIEDVARALASYVRTIVSGNSPYDRYMAGDRRTLAGGAIRGLALFNGKAACSVCHSGPTMTDERFHNTGIAWRAGTPTDQGRAAITHKAEDRGAFKTPTLREISRTAPYMHDGSFPTLNDVIDYYDRGGQRNSGLDPKLRPLGLSAEEKADLIAFLASLEGTIREGR
jgi:cytochrome c peroxidase